MTRITFEEVSVKATKRWKDPVTGKTRGQTRKFFQTVSPFNRGTDGQPRTREQIRASVQAECDAWMKEPAP